MNKWNASFTQYPRCAEKGKEYMNGTQIRCFKVHKEDFAYMGYSIRTDTWRYTVRALIHSQYNIALLMRRRVKAGTV
jgi:hypothetical protein